MRPVPNIVGRPRNAWRSLLLAVAFTCAGWFQSTQASHFNSAEISYKCIGACAVRVTVNAFKICNGDAGYPPPMVVSQILGCDTLNYTNYQYGLFPEITPTCPTTASSCTWVGPNIITGVYQERSSFDYDYCGKPSNCIWTINWQGCCRAGNVTSGQSNTPYNMSSATIDASLNTCNNSAQFELPFEVYACVGQSMTLTTGAIDPDGDSLVYSLAPCVNGLSYSPGYSASQPLGSSWNAAFDSKTGNLQLTPQPGNPAVGVTCVYIEEFRNGQLINTVSRDWQLSVIDCNGNAYPSFTPYSNVTPGISVTGDEFQAIAGSPFCFDIGAIDSNPGQVLELSWLSGPAGATFTDTLNTTIADTITGSSPVGQFCFTPPAPGNYRFFVLADDNHCPMLGRARKQIVINAPAPGTSATAQGGNCLSAQFSASVSGNVSGLSYQWSGPGGLSSTQANFSHTYPGPGNFPWEVIISNGSFLSDTIRDTVTVAPTEITGTIFNTAATYLINERVDLLRLDANLNTLVVIDSTLTDAFGNYKFCNILHDSVYVQARPNLNTAPGNMLTYADTAIYWNNSLPFLNATLPNTVNFSCRPLNLPAGNCAIGGTINNFTSQSPQSGLQVILRLPPSTEAVAYTTTDVNGYFNIGNLAPGTYAVSVDKPFVDEVNVPMVTISAQNCLGDSLLFDLHPTFLDQVLVALDPGQLNWNIKVIPNPAGDQVQLRIEPGESREMQIRLLDIQGKSLAELLPPSTVMNQLYIDFNTSELANGLYFLEVRSDGRRQVEKLMIRR